MFEDYSIARFIFSFLFVIFLIYGVYFLIMRYGQKFSIPPKGEIKVKDIRYLSKDKGLILVELKGEKYFFSFDNQNGLKLIKIFKKEEIDEEELS